MNFLRSFFVVLSFAASVRAGELDAFLADPTVWNSTARELAGKFPELKFSWSSTDHSVARLLEKNRLFDEPLAEVTFAMEEEKPVALNVIFYNRGDSGELSREMMMTLVSNVQRRVGLWMGSKGVALNDQLKTSGVRRDGMMWTNAMVAARLTWSFSTKDVDGKFGFRAEYVTLHIACVGAKASMPQLAGGTVSAGALKAKIKREANGDIVLTGVPMVDQGEKGYCAVASAERVMRFYGMNVDQHELAQLASSSAQGGTDPRAMLESLRRVGIKIGCKVKVIEEFSVQELLRMLERYNSAAKKMKLPEIKTGKSINLADIYARMDADVLRSVRTKSSGDLKNFLGDVTENVEAAIPVLWGVQLGKVAEKPVLPKQASGGHMRLIIGSNPKTSEIIYTDSWGSGHELKRMKLDDAWMITCSLYTIEPRRTTQ